MPSNQRRLSRTHKLWIVDITLFAVFMLVMNVPLTGIAIHEWLGITIGASLIVHLVQHGNWLATITQRFRNATSFRNRLNYVMTGLLLFVHRMAPPKLPGTFPFSIVKPSTTAAAVSPECKSNPRPLPSQSMIVWAAPFSDRNVIARP